MKKLLYLIPIFLLAGAEAAQVKYVQIGTGALQPGTTAGFNVSSGTVQELNVVNMTSTGTVSGTITNNSSTTFTAIERFKNQIHVSTGMATSAVFSVSQSSITVGASGAPAIVFGTQTNDDPPTGAYGQYGSSFTASTGASVITSGAYFDVISTQTFQPGDYDLYGEVMFAANGASFSSTSAELCINFTPGNTTSGCTDGDNYFYMAAAFPTSFNHSPSLFVYRRLQVAAGTTQNVYLKGYLAAFTVAQPKVRGGLRWRRVR